MTMIPGVTIQKNAAGRITHVTIDVEQQEDLARPVLEKIAAKKPGFKERFEKGIPIEESRRTILEMVRKYYEDKH